MSIWEFAATVDGWNKHHGDNKPEPPSEDEFDEIMGRFDQQFGTMH